MKGLKNVAQSLIFIIVIVALGGFLLPSTQKIEKTIIIKATPEKVYAALDKSIASMVVVIKKNEGTGKISFISRSEGFTLQNKTAVTVVKEGCELTWIVSLDTGGSILNRYRLLINRSIEEGNLKEKMVSIKMESEKK